MDNAFIQLHDGIILNMDWVGVIQPAGQVGTEQRYNVSVMGASIQITSDEYKTIKKYYETKILY